MADHVFICYAHEDEDFVLKLAANLKGRGVPVWIDRWDIPPTADWDLTIDNALYECAQLLIVLSPAAVGRREVRGELRTALDENKPIVPVLYRACRVPRQLRMIQYVDFTNRGPDDRAALGEVLRALGVQEASTSQAEGEVPVTIAPPKKEPFEPELVRIPAGEFLMGSDPKKDELAFDNERPQHTLYLPDYHMARTPVTNAQYAAFVRATDHLQPKHWESGRAPGGQEDHPVVYVSWGDALAYCHWLAEVTGKRYGLPSEAEWEKAARGDDGRIYPWGDRWDAALCNSGEGGPGGTTPVGAYPQGASPYGLLDMAGSAWEWTRSQYKRYPYDSDDGRESVQANDEVLRVMRGGAFPYDRGGVRCAFRYIELYPDFRLEIVGFRVVVAPG